MTYTSATTPIPEKYLNLETMMTKITPFMNTGDVDAHLMDFQHSFRVCRWWWDLPINANHDMDFKSLDTGVPIFTGGLSKTTCDPNLPQQMSEVLVVGEDGEPKWFVLVVQLRGSYELTIDVIVHHDVKIKEIFKFLVTAFRLKEDSTTEMFIWAMDNEGGVNVEDLDGQLNLNLTHTSPVLEMPFDRVFKTMQAAAEKMKEITAKEESDDHEIPHEWQLVENITFTLWSEE